jgi:hypothetical protein
VQYCVNTYCTVPLYSIDSEKRTAYYDWHNCHWVLALLLVRHAASSTQRELPHTLNTELSTTVAAAYTAGLKTALRLT